MKLTERFPRTTAFCFIAFCLFVTFCVGILTSRLIIACKAKSNTPIDTTARFLSEIREADRKREVIKEIEIALRWLGYKWVATKEFDDSIVIIATQTKGDAE